ncbi:MAG: prepilin peptidase [Candidatus Pacebacteria bacterium]|nr:prepilin peptidase [Candidatus Paceibacterota bacterium]MBP9842661.1 prepilin peptidase [Candidatus Paceibacterota bacterium]
MSVELLRISPLLFITISFLYGVIIGSFLNVYIYRFHTGKSLSGRSHCLSCGTRLSWYELLPLVSYLGLRGKCRTCCSLIPSRYFIVELLTGVLFAATSLISNDLIEILYLWIVSALLVVIAVYDIRHFIIPDALTFSLVGLIALWTLYRFWLGVPLVTLGTDIFAALAGVGFFFFLWFISHGRWLGFGDVKLAFPLGLLVGAPYVFSMIVTSFWIGAVVSVTLVVLSKFERGKLYLRFATPKLTIKSVVPFAPFLIAGCLLVLFTHLNVLTLFTF